MWSRKMRPPASAKVFRLAPLASVWIAEQLWPSQERTTTSYLASFVESANSVVAEAKLAPPSAAEKVLAPKWTPSEPTQPTYMCTRPFPESVVNSESAIPILRSRHSSASECPVDTANCGKWPSD